MSADVAARLEAVAARLEAVAKKLGKGGSGGSSGDDAEIPMEVTEWDEIISTIGAQFVGTAQELGIEEIVACYNDLTAFCRNYMIAAAQCSKPSDAELKAFVAPLQAALGVAADVIRDDFFDFRKGWSEAAGAFQWVLTPGPHSYIGGVKDSSQFYLNKVLVAAKRIKDDDNKVALYKNFNKFLLQLFAKMVDFTKENYKTGVSWTGSKPLSEFSGAPAPAAAAAAAPAKEEAKKPAPEAKKPAASSSAAAAPGGLGSVFAELNAKREAGSVTAGFKKVTKAMKTKNMKDKPVLKAKPKPFVRKAREAKKPSRPPKKALTRGKWIVEYFENGDETVSEALLKHTVYIYKCKNQVIRVPSKVKTVIVDNCNRVTVVVADVVSMVECVNSSGTKVFVDGVVPSIAVDGCKGFQGILTEKAIASPPVVIAASSSEMNILIPNGDEDPVEVALSEQFEHRVDVAAKSVACTPVEHG